MSLLTTVCDWLCSSWKIKERRQIFFFKKKEREREKWNLSKGLVSIGVESSHSGNAFQDGGGFLPCGGECLAMAAPRGEEFDQDHSIRIQHLRSDQ